MQEWETQHMRNRERGREGRRAGSHEGLKEIIACGDSITVATEQGA